MGGRSSRPRRPRRISSYFRKPRPLPRHRVSIGNWTNYVKNRRRRYRWDSPYMWFLVGRGGGQYDPARGCRKSFQSNYKCGNGPFKSRNVGAEAWGRWAFFDCRREINSCNAYRLSLIHI